MSKSKVRFEEAAILPEAGRTLITPLGVLILNGLRDIPTMFTCENNNF